MTTARHPRPADPASASSVLTRVRASTRRSHESVESILDLMNPQVDRARVRAVVQRLGGFWAAAESGLDAWAARSPQDAATAGWAGRRRAGAFRDAAQVLDDGSVVDDGSVADPSPSPVLAGVTGTGEALGRIYVLEGSSLGGRYIAGHLAAVLGPVPPGPDWRCFDPYGDTAGAVWHTFRSGVVRWVEDGGDPDAVERGAVTTFAALDAWCAPLRAAA